MVLLFGVLVPAFTIMGVSSPVLDKSVRVSHYCALCSLCLRRYSVICNLNYLSSFSDLIVLF
jgi:hypothetical protein